MAAQSIFLVGMAGSLHASLPVVAVFYAGQGVAGGLWAPARQQWIHSVLPAAGIPRANASLGAVSGLMTIVGAALGGALSVWSPAGTLAVAAAVQLVALIPVIALATVKLAPVRTASGRMRAALLGGITELRNLPLARSVVWIGIAWGFIGGAYNVMLTAYAIQLLHGGSTLVGTFYVIDGLGVILGSALAARIAARRHLTAYALAYLIQGAAWGAMFALREPVAGGILLAAMRVASGVIIALDTTILLAGVPAPMRGRIMSVHLTSYNAVSRLALAAFSALLTFVGIGTLGMVTGCLSAALGAAWWLSQRSGSQQRYQLAISSDQTTVANGCDGRRAPAAARPESGCRTPQ